MDELTNDRTKKLARIVELGKLSGEARAHALAQLDRANRILGISKDFARKSLELLAEMKTLEEEMKSDVD